jgi:hypothetical protein
MLRLVTGKSIHGLFEHKCSHGIIFFLCEYKVNFLFMDDAKTNLFTNAVTTNVFHHDCSHGKLICWETKARKIGMYGKLISS